MHCQEIQGYVITVYAKMGTAYVLKNLTNPLKEFILKVHIVNKYVWRNYEKARIR